MNRKMIVAAVVVVALCAGAFGWSQRGGAKVGERLHAVDVDGDGVQYVAPVPFGELTARVTSAPEAQRGDEQIRAPRGGRVVRVAWSLDNRTNGSGVVPAWPGATAAQRREPSIQVDLVAGGRTYAIGRGLRASDQDGVAVIAVDGDAADARVRVTSAGRSITAEPEARRPRQRESQQCAADRPGDTEGVVCRLTAVRFAYIAGLGWAPDGHEWILVREATAGLRSRQVFGVKVADGAPGVSYRAAGSPTVALSATGARLMHRAGESETTSDGRVSLEQRVYAAPVGRGVTMTLRFRQEGVLAQPTPGQPGQRTADRSMTVIL